SQFRKAIHDPVSHINHDTAQCLRLSTFCLILAPECCTMVLHPPGRLGPVPRACLWQNLVPRPWQQTLGRLITLREVEGEAVEPAVGHLDSPERGLMGVLSETLQPLGRHLEVIKFLCFLSPR